jgi:hypothetical protein
MATKKELIDQRKALQRKVRSGSATDADKRKLKRVQIELGSKGKTTAKAKAPAPKVKRQKASLQREAASRKAEASRRAALQQLFEDSLPIDEDVAGRALDQGAYAEYPEPQRAALNKALQRPSGATGPRRVGSADNQLRGGPSLPGKNPTETDLMYMIGQQRPDPSMMTPLIRRGVSRVPRPTGPVGRLPSPSDFERNPPVRSRDIDEDVAGRRGLPSPSDFERNPPVRSRDIDEDVAGRRGLPSLELMSKAPQADGFVGDEPGAPYRSSGGRGEMEGNRGYETLREYFIEDMSPRKSNVMTPFGIIEIDSTQEGMFPEEDMYMEKKGGRLKKKKRVARKKAAPKKKKVAAKKKPVVRKKAVAKKPPMRKKTVAKKPAGRKRAAKRGFGAELRGN